MDPAARDQLALAPASPAADIIDQPRRMRASGTVILSHPRQLTADRARRAAPKLSDRPQAAALIMPGENHARFRAVAVLVSSVHCNI